MSEAREVIAGIPMHKTVMMLDGAERADSILSALDAAGYVVVPKEPSEEMVKAYVAAANTLDNTAAWTVSAPAAERTANGLRAALASVGTEPREEN